MIALTFSSFCIIIALCAFIIIKRHSRVIKLINKIPGPKSYPIIGTSYHFLRTPRNKRFGIFDEYIKKYGRIFRLWMGSQPVVVLTNPEDAEVILTSLTHLDKSLGYKFMHKWLGTGLLTSTGSKWHKRRKMLTPAFHFSILETFFDIIVENTERFLEKLSEKEHSEEFDVFPYVNNWTLDVICETAMGVKMNTQGGSSDYMRCVKEMGEVILYRATRPWIWPESVHYFTKNYEKETGLRNILHGFTLQVIQQRIKERKIIRYTKNDNANEVGDRGRKAFLDLLLDISEDNQLTDVDIREEVDTFMFEGHDTTSAAVTWAIYLLGTHMDIQEKVHEELTRVFGPSSRIPTKNDLTQLKYLDMVIKESLRLYPAVPFIGRTLATDMRIGEYLVPTGTVIDIAIYRIHRNPVHYISPDEFNPENFSIQNTIKRHPFAFIPFSAGPRNCIGQKFAMLQEKVILSSLFRKYRVTATQKKEDLSVVAELVLRSLNGIKINISLR